MKKTIIACTGGIGSGKSAIVEAFAALGIPAYDCDSRTKALYRTDAALAGRIVQLMGSDILDADGHLDTRRMAARVFSDAALLESLEAIVHPAVAEDFRRWALEQESDIVIMESAILQQKPFFDKFANFIITVSAPEEVRIQRVMIRDGVSREQAERRLANQWTDEQRAAKADLVLKTDDTHPVLPSIMRFLETLREG